MDEMMARRLAEGAHLPSREPRPPPRDMTPEEQTAHTKLGAMVADLEEELLTLPENSHRDRAIGVLEDITFWAYKSRIGHDLP
jgi:hypothetical protein